ncbi:helix-turn-helix transcriptional regulator [Agromyces seonyuensis]|uniref:WYL domain-containing protein n=1 Tax=Agromyces seonyuensis TaxID=2662446 RepID=A0A6I4P3Y0_9MICO|nr:WYL domain-containing protein [Agromyces seonyuensis]MWB98077.1 WYL domain-containing protein [Agromyces seonyuensis]
MRADRLVAALLLLQARGLVTARELAEELEISLATARRDFEALSAAGIPVYPQAGRGGGWRLLGGGRTDLSGLTADEARGLFALLGPASARDAPAGSALRKLLRALPETFRADAAAAADAVVVDPSPWGAVTRPRPAWADLLQHAIVERRAVRFGYARSGTAADREVDPLGLAVKHDRWYLLARRGGEHRTYLLDRMTDVEVLERTFERPDGYDATAAWAGIVAELEANRSRVAAVVVVDDAVVDALLDRFGRHAERLGDGPPTPEGRPTALVRAAAHSDRGLAEQLAPWSVREVRDAPGVAAELGALGRDLAARFGRA